MKDNLFLVDSHCHLDRLDFSHFKGGINEVLKTAKNAGVGYFLNVCVHPDNFPHLLDMAIDEPSMVASVGLHPTEKIIVEPTVEQLVNWATHPKVVALGETGLDYYWDDAEKERQQLRFRRHIQAARLVKKPLIIHTRAAVKDTLSILKEENAAEVGGVLHCFTEDLSMAQIAIEQFNFYISFSGILTFKNSHYIQEAAKKLPLERLLIETDAPYLTPVPFRGKPNQPAYVKYTAQKLADLHEVRLEAIAQHTTYNFFKLFLR